MEKHPVRIDRPIQKIHSQTPQETSLFAWREPGASWIEDEGRILLEVFTCPIKQTAIVREAPVEHLFQALDARAVLLVGVQRAPVVGNPVDEPVGVPGTNERLAQIADFAQACGDLEVAGETGSAFRASGAETEIRDRAT